MDGAWPGMRLSEVLDVVGEMSDAGCRVWVGGGWGVDALVGRQSRAHRDLDLAIDAGDEPSLVRVLQRRGSRVETDWRPVRVELVAAGRGWVDVHPVVFDSLWRGRQADMEGGHFDCPTDAFT